MRVVIQRVREAQVTVAGDVIGRIGHGLLLLVGFSTEECETDLDWMVQKIIKLRIFSDAGGVMNLDVQQAGGRILAVSQFTLYASTRKGNRPSWSRAARGEVSQPMFERFVQKLATAHGQPVSTGLFGADMQVQLVNDGPVTICLDSQSLA